jgi:hypothetical protein
MSSAVLLQLLLMTFYNCEQKTALQFASDEAYLGPPLHVKSATLPTFLKLRTGVLDFLPGWWLYMWKLLIKCYNYLLTLTIFFFFPIRLAIANLALFCKFSVHI